MSMPGTSSSYNTGSDLDIEKTQKAFTTVNARVGIRGPDDAWSVEVWAQNLFNKQLQAGRVRRAAAGLGTQRGVEAGFDPARFDRSFTARSSASRGPSA